MHEDSIQLQIVTASGVAFDCMASYVGLPLVGGSIGVLANHAPLLAAVQAGVVECETGGERKKIPVGDGIVEIHDNQVLLLTRAVQDEQRE